MMVSRYFISVLLLTFSGLLLAQKTQIVLDKEGLYKTGIELFDKKQYLSLIHI